MLKIVLALLGAFLAPRAVQGQTAQCDFSLKPRPFLNISQPVEHSDPTQGSWAQRYTQIEEFYQSGGPILFYAGPENAATSYELLCLNLSPMAKELGAWVVGPEHRFFGNSLPSNTSFASMTVENALADYANLIRQFKGTLGQDTKVVVFGGSYGGFLSAMMRVKYPELVDGSVASAAPIYLWGSGVIPDSLLVPRWFDRLGQIVTTKDPHCAAQMQAGFRLVQGMLAAGDSERAALAEALRLCHTPGSGSTQSFEVLYYMKKAVQVVTQFNFPFRGAAKVGNAFSDTCAQFTASKDNSTMLSAVSHLLDLGKNNSGALSCHNYDGAGSVERRLAVNDVNFAESWYYLCCTEFVMPIAGGDEFFGFVQGYDFAGVSRYCDSKFNSTVKLFSPGPLHAILAGNVSNIIFSNQGFDPTATFSLNATVPSKVGGDPAMFLDIPGGAHTIDSDDVVAARKLELDAVKRWVAS